MNTNGLFANLIAVLAVMPFLVEFVAEAASFAWRGDALLGQLTAFDLVGLPGPRRHLPMDTVSAVE